MGTHHLQLHSAYSMIHLIYLACLSVTWAAPQPPVYPTSAPTQEYHPDIGQTNVGGYGVNKGPYCHMVEKVVFENQCEPYTEQTCWTQNQEECACYVQELHRSHRDKHRAC